MWKNLLVNWIPVLIVSRASAIWIQWFFLCFCFYCKFHISSFLLFVLLHRIILLNCCATVLVVVLVTVLRVSKSTLVLFMILFIFQSLNLFSEYIDGIGKLTVFLFGVLMELYNSILNYVEMVWMFNVQIFQNKIKKKKKPKRIEHKIAKKKIKNKMPVLFTYAMYILMV